MSEFEDKLNKILSSPEDMEKIMSIAKSFSGSPETSPEAASAPGSGDGLDLGALSSMLGNIDPKMIGILSRLLREYSSKSNDKSALISALKPYLKENRREKIDKAADIARLAKIARVAFSEFSGGKDDV